MDKPTQKPDGFQTKFHVGRANGILAIALAAILFGAAGAFAKLLFSVQVSPVDLTAIRTIIALLVFAMFLMATSPSSLGFKRTHLPVLLALGITFTAVNITFYMAISKIRVAAAITLEYTAPFFVLFMSVVAGMRRLRTRDLLLVLFAILGCLLLTGTSGTLFSASQGVLWGLACGLSFGIFNMIGNACKQLGIGATTVTFHSFLVSACIWLPALPFLSIDTIPITAETIFFVGFICVVATIVPYWLLMYGLRHVDALPATIIGMLDPVAAGAFAWLLVGERLTPGNVVGIAIIIGAVTMASLADANRTATAGKAKKQQAVWQNKGGEMDKVIAFSSFSIMKKPYGDPVVAGFESLIPSVFQVAEQAKGFIARAKVTDNLEHLGNFERDWGAWGAFAVPDYYDGGFTSADETHAGTLSIWEDIESVHNFTYSGLHGIAFKQRHKWFRDIDYPTHVMWWINRGETPTWKQSVARYDSLYANGPTAFAFNFQQSFDSAGNPLTGFDPAG